MYFLFNLFWVICIGKRRFVDPSLKMEDHIHVRVTEFKVIPMIQEIRKEIGMIAPNWNLLQVDYEFSLSLSLRRWGHHFLGHALVVRMAQHIHVGYCSQKKFLNPEKKKTSLFLMFKFGGCFQAFCYNRIHLDPRSFRRNDDSSGSHDWGWHPKASQPLSSAKKSCRRCKFLASFEWEKMARL